MKTMFNSGNHKDLRRIGIFLLMLVLVAGTVSCPVCPAPEPTVYSIDDWHGLDRIRLDLRGNYVLEDNLDSNTDGYHELVGHNANGGEGWEPILGFRGAFDGQGHEISGLFIDRPDEENVGLFGHVDRGIVKNVHVVNADVTGGKRVGSLVGFNWGTVTTDIGYDFTSSSGTVSALGNAAGGLVGRNNYIVTHSESSATVQGQISVGGLVGVNYAFTSVVSSSSASGTVSGYDGVGGLVGINHHKVVDSSASGQVWGEPGNGVGGLVGRNLGRVSHSNSSGNVNGNSDAPAMVKYSLDGGVDNPLADVLPGDSDIGGLVGHNGPEAVVSESYSTGSVTGTYNVGGLAGLNEGAVEDCSAAGSVTGISHVGGLVGGNDGTVDSCSSSGSVTGESAVGRLVGHNTQTGIVSNSVSTSTVAGIPDGGDLIGRDDRVTVPPQPKYDLTTYSDTGGSVTSPGEGTFTYDAGTAVDLVATPINGYRFLSWTGDVGTVADVNAASTTITMNGDYSITASFEGAVQFADPNLEAAIRKAMDKHTGPIYPSDLQWLTSLDAPERNIADLTGLEYCTALTYLSLRDNQISDISPLEGLTGLGLLSLSGNQISDISPLEGLTNLVYLVLHNNQVSDIWPLAGLTKLTELYLWDNQIDDISPLEGLTKLTWLSLENNHISDIWALVDNPGLGKGDYVDLRLNPLSEDSIWEAIPILQARGVSVYYTVTVLP